MHGLIHYIYGNGPGKTSAAFGKVIRSFGHNHNPIIVQFLKQSTDYPQKERTRLECLQIEVSDLIQKYNITDKPEQQTGFTYGEYVTFTRWLKIPVIQIGNPTFFMPGQVPSAEFLTKFEFGIELLERIMKNESYHLVVLDEINTAVSLGFVDVNRLISIISARNPQVEIILTGREKIPELIEISDYVTQILNEKHPFNKGVTARIGIEF